MAAPTVTLLSRVAMTTNTSAPSSASTTPSASGQILVAVIHATDNPPPDAPTAASGGSLSTTSWTAIGAGVKHTSFGFRATYAFWAESTGTGTGTVDFDFSGDATSGQVISVYEADADTTAPIVQSDFDEGTGTSAALALSSFATNSSCLIDVGVNVNSATMTPDGSLTGLGTVQSHTVPNQSGHGAWLNTEDTSPSMTISSGEWTAFACELAESGGGGGGISPAIVVHHLNQMRA